MSKNISASHILIMHKDSQSSRSELTKDEAFKKINKIYKEVIKTPELFSDIALKNSDCSSASSGGALGSFGKGMMVKEFEDSAFSLKENEISTPIETDFGFHVIKRDS
jgi:peptidyl-prolyl cis-trans isomerase D